MVILHTAIALLALALTIVYLPKVRAHLPLTCLLVAMGILHGVAPAATPSSMRTMDAADISRTIAAWYALAGLLAVVGGYQLHYQRLRRSEHGESEEASRLPPASEKLMERYFWTSMVLGLVGAFLYVRSAGVGLAEYAEASRFEFRNLQNTLLMWPGQYLFHLSFAPGFLGQFLSRRYRILGTVHALASAVLAFSYLFQGTRHIALGIVGGVAFGYIYSRRLTPLRVATIAVSGLALILSTIALYEVRKELSDLSFSEVVAKTFSVESYQDPLTRDPLNYHEHFVGAVEFFPNEHPYLHGATYRRMLAFFLPGADYPLLKPEHAARVFANVVYGDIYDPMFRAVHPPSLLGDAYINFWGWPGLVALFLNGMAISWIAGAVRRDPVWFLGIGPHLAWFCILTPRGSPYDYFVMGLFLVLATRCIGPCLGNRP